MFQVNLFYKYNKKKRFISFINNYIEEFESFYCKSNYDDYVSYTYDIVFTNTEHELGDYSKLERCLDNLRHIKRQAVYLDFLKLKKRQSNINRLIN